MAVISSKRQELSPARLCGRDKELDVAGEQYFVAPSPSHSLISYFSIIFFISKGHILGAATWNITLDII